MAVSDAADGFDPETDSVLRATDLTKKFGDFVALDGVDLDVRDGEFRSVIGPNGAGKTTLFNCITGALAPTRGRIYFRSEDVTDRQPHERVRLGMGREETQRTIQLINDLLADRTLLLVEHDIDLVMNVSDSITVLNRGQVIATGAPDEIADDDAVQRAYLGGVRE